MDFKALNEQGYSWYEMYKILEENLKKHPDSPNKPRLATKHTSDDVFVYQAKLKEYEQEYANYQNIKSQIKIENQKLWNDFEEFLIEDNGLNTLSPELQKIACNFLYDEMSSPDNIVDKYQKLSAIVELINKVRSI